MHPIWVDLNSAVTLLEEDDVRHDVGARICFESIVGKSDSAKEFCTLGDVSANLRGLLIHRIARGDKGNHATRTDLIQCLCEKVIVNRKTQLIISWIVYLVVSKGDIADGKVEEVTPVRGLKTGNSDVCMRIELLRNPACDAVQLHTIQVTGRHTLRQHAEEIAHTHCGFQDVASGEPHAINGFIDCTDDGGTGIVSIQCGCPCCLIFGSGQ